MTDENKPLNYRTLSELYAAYNSGVAFEVTDSEGTYPETYPVTGMSLTEDAAGIYVFAKTSTFPHVPWSVFLPDGSLEDHSFLHLRHSPEPATERYFTVVYKLTDANVAKYLSNRDWVTYVYADSMAELANLKELSAEPAQPVAWALQWPDDSRLNLSTVFDTQVDAEEYRAKCREGVEIVPLSAQPSAQEDAKDAARWCWIANYLIGNDTSKDDGIVACTTVEQLEMLVDTEIAAQQGDAA